MLVCRRGRSGSNLLVELLNSHPQIQCHSEALSKQAVYATLPGPTYSVASRDANRSRFLDALFSTGALLILR